MRITSTDLASQPSVVSQRGAYVVEFAFVFILLFILIYGLLTFGMVFAAQQSLNLSAQEGARSLLRYQDSNSPTNTCSSKALGSGTAAAFEARTTRAVQCVLDQASWIEQLAQGMNNSQQDILGVAICNQSGALLQRAAGQCTLNNLAINEIEVTVSYNYSHYPLIPDFGFVHLYGKIASPSALSNTQRVRIPQYIAEPTP